MIDRPSPPPVPPLLAHQVRDWVGPVPPRAVALVTVVTVVAAVGVAIAGDTEVSVTAEEAQSLGWYVEGLVASVVLAGLALLLVSPVLGAVVAGLGGLASGLMGVPVASAWTGAGVLLLLLALVDGLLRTRRRAVVHVTLGSLGGLTLVPDVAPPLRDALLRTGRLRLVGAVACALAGLVGLGFVVRDAEAAAAFRADALVATTTVDAVEDDDGAATVTVHGTVYRVPLPATYRKVGERVEVRYDPATGRAELTDDVFDPTLAMVPGVVGLAVGAALARSVVRDRRRHRRLLGAGGPAVLMRATWSARHSGAVLTCHDDATRPVVVAPGLATWIGPEDDWAGEQDTGHWHPTHGDEDDASGPELDVAGMSDAELLELARNLAVEADESVVEEAGDLAPGWDGSPVVVVGLLGTDAPVALQDATGRWYVSGAAHPPPVGLPQALLGLGQPVGHGPRRQPPRVDEEGPSAWRRFSERLDRRGTAFARRTGRWLPWAVLPLLWWLLDWMFVEASMIQVVGLVLGAATWGWSWSVQGQVRLALREQSLLVRRPFLDEVVPWAWVTSAVADDRAVVVRIRTPAGADDALLLPCDLTGSALTRTEQTPADVVAEIESRRRAATTASAVRGGLRPSVPLLAGMSWLLAGALAALV